MEQTSPAVLGPVEPPVRPLVARLRLHADNKTKQAMQRDCQMAADDIEALCAALSKLCDAADATHYPLHGTAWDSLWNCAVAARKVLAA